jgi:hypothetical protein
MIQPIQIVLIIFAVFALSRAWLQFKEGKIKKVEMVSWMILWIGVIAALLVPSSVGYISGLLGIGRPVDLVVYLAIILLFYLNFRTYVAIDAVEEKITKVVREVSIQRVKKK